jgi:hypothetical protein
MSGPQADRDRRLVFAIPPIAEPDEDMRWLDPADADDRALLIAAALAALPESWERARPGGPHPPAARAAHAVDAKKRRKAERAARRRNRRR